MIDQEMLQALSQLIDQKLAGSEQRTKADTAQLIAAAESRITKSTVTLMDAEFKPRFDLLAEGQDEILRRMPSEDDI